MQRLCTPVLTLWLRSHGCVEKCICGWHYLIGRPRIFRHTFVVAASFAAILFLPLFAALWRVEASLMLRIARYSWQVGASPGIPIIRGGSVPYFFFGVV